MVAQILSFEARQRQGRDWSPAEIAEFYRVTDLLSRAGLPIIAESGCSDEGDPWIAFLREDTGDVIAHIARIDGDFIAASVTTDEVFKGRDFRHVLDQIMKRQPLVLPASRASGERLFMHPAAILTAFLATAMINTAQEDHGSGRPVWASDGDGGVMVSDVVSEMTPNVLRAALQSKAELNRQAQQAEAPMPAGAGNALHILNAAMAAVSLALLSADQAGGEMLAQQAPVSAGAGEEAARAADLREQAKTKQLALLEAHEQGQLQAAPEAIALDHAALAAEDAALAEAALELRGGEKASASAEPMAGTWQLAWQPDLGPGEAAGEQPEMVASLSGEEGGDLALTAQAMQAVIDSVQQAAAGERETLPPLAAGESQGEVQTYRFELSETALKLFNLSSTSGSLVFNESGNLLIVNNAATQLSTRIDLDSDTPETIAAGGQQEAAGDPGNAVINSILSFAFGAASEIKLGQGGQFVMESVLDSNPHTAQASRIIIFEAPGVAVEMFQFSQDIVMMTRKMAELYLGQVAESDNAYELALNDGSAVALIGVIDLA